MCRQALVSGLSLFPGKKHSLQMKKQFPPRQHQEAPEGQVQLVEAASTCQEIRRSILGAHSVLSQPPLPQVLLPVACEDPEAGQGLA